MWKEDVNLSNVNKYKQKIKTFGDMLSCRVAGQNFFSQEVFVTSLIDLKLNFKYGQQFKCLSWEMFCQVQVNA